MKLRTVFAVLAVAVAALFAAVPAYAAAPAVPVPAVTGPIPVTATSYPFLATDVDLSKYGYVEEEYFISGRAFRYDTSAPVPPAPRPVDLTATRIETGGTLNDGTYPFKTRIVVRRPANPAKANGTVVAEWNNVTAFRDIEWNWFGDPEFMLKNGYTFVGVTAQNVGVTGLKAFNAARYGDLEVRWDPAGNTAPLDDLSYDVYGAALNAIKGGGTGVDPLGGINADTVIASGESQSCGRLAAHYNWIEPLQNIADAYLLTVCGTSLRADRPEKVVRILSETENRTSRPEATFPDTTSIRHWEVAGASHLPRLAWDAAGGLLNRDFLALTVGCQKFPLSLVQWPFTANRAIAGLVDWVKSGTALPIAPRGEYVANPAYNPMLPVSGSNQPQILDRDQFGIAKGGIRYPELTVPTGVNDGINAAGTGGNPAFNPFCTLLGSNTVFSSEQLHGLYADFADYVSKYADATDDFLATGFILPEDAVRLKAMSRQFPYLRPAAPMKAGTKATKGTFNLNWVATEAPDTTFELQQQSSKRGAAWVRVIKFRGEPNGAGQLRSKSQGTFAYRVRSSTVIPANNIAPAQTVTTPFSEQLAKVKVDRTGPKAPRLVIRGRKVGKGVYSGPVRVIVVGKPDPKLPDGSAGVGLNPRSVPKARTITRKGRTVIKVQTRDQLGNRSRIKRQLIRIR